MRRAGRPQRLEERERKGKERKGKRKGKERKREKEKSRADLGAPRAKVGPPPHPAFHGGASEQRVTNPCVEGWLSIDRSEGAALLRTKPRPRSRSSTNGLAPGSPRTCVAWRARGRPPFRPHPVSRDEGLSTPDPGPSARQTDRARRRARRRGRRGTGYPRPTEAPRRCRIVPPGRDSDLEAFSHNPTDGSFAPLAPQPSTYTKCLNLRFLSYWAGLPWQQHIISRVKLTCLTTV